MLLCLDEGEDDTNVSQTRGERLSVKEGAVNHPRQPAKRYSALEGSSRLDQSSTLPLSLKSETSHTLGASATIFPHPFNRRALLTTLPTREPSISLLLLISTAALSSNRTTRPSGRISVFLVLTTTARRTSPRFTLSAAAVDVFAEPDSVDGIERARSTTHTIWSPTPAKPWPDLFLSTLTHSTRRAPVLSII